MRQREIEEWMRLNANSDDVWIALDDLHILFEPNCKNLFLTNGSIGLDYKTANEFNDFCHMISYNNICKFKHLY